MNTILLQMSDAAWTLQALHLACAMARTQGGEIVLVRFISVPHPSYLGSAFGDVPPSGDECQMLKECAATAEDYGVELSIRSMQCINTLDALVDAAEQLDADAIFAHIPKNRVPYWQAFQLWNMRRRLARAFRELFTLDNALPSQSDEEYTPSVTVSSMTTPFGK